MSSSTIKSIDNAKELGTGVAVYFGIQLALTAASVFALSFIF